MNIVLPLLASLVSELIDSASLRYLRRRALRDGAEEGKSFRLRIKRNPKRPNGHMGFLAKKSNFYTNDSSGNYYLEIASFILL